MQIFRRLTTRGVFVLVVALAALTVSAPAATASSLSGKHGLSQIGSVVRQLAKQDASQRATTWRGLSPTDRRSIQDLFSLHVAIAQLLRNATASPSYRLSSNTLRSLSFLSMQVNPQADPTVLCVNDPNPVGCLLQVVAPEEQLVNTVLQGTPSPVCDYLYLSGDPCDSPDVVDPSTLPSATDPVCSMLCGQGTPGNSVVPNAPVGPSTEPLVQSTNEPFAQAVIKEIHARPADAPAWIALLDSMKDTVLNGGVLDGLGVSPDAALEQVQAALDCLVSGDLASGACTIDAATLAEPPTVIGGNVTTPQFPVPRVYSFTGYPLRGHAINNRFTWTTYFETDHKECNAYRCTVDGRVSTNLQINPGAIASLMQSHVFVFDPSGFFGHVYISNIAFCYRSLQFCGTQDSPDLQDGANHQWSLYTSATLNGDRLSIGSAWRVHSNDLGYDEGGLARTPLAYCRKRSNVCRWK